jgi:SAM-dependent methyltransferase
MSCYLCESTRTFPIMLLDADIYEESIGIKHDRRHWYKCEACGLCVQDNILTDKDLERIYSAYRNTSMRGKTVKEEFDRIVSIQYSENKDRVAQLLVDGFEGGSLLDIGSGLGVFPYEIKPYMKEVFCIEPNSDSVDFINSLGIKCHQGYYRPKIFKRKFDYISIVHVLEHQRNPIKFLSDVASELEEGGTVYIEVPDAIEFEYLDRNHDEFNSTHLWMFDVPTLDRICRKAGLKPYLIRRTKYGERNLSRIRLLAHQQ